MSGADFVESPDAPSAFMLSDGRMVRRVRMYGIAVGVNELVIDDSSGSVLVRTFGNAPDIDIGVPVLVIGRPRMFEGEVYILGELIRSIDSAWLDFAKKRWPKKAKKPDPVSVVKGLDAGEGADYDEVVAKLGKGGEELVVHLLAVGELFETRPGKLKVLE